MSATQSSCAFQWRKTLYQIGIAIKVMFAVGGMNTAFCFSYQQFVAFQQIKEFISSYTDVVFFEKWLKHDE
jgi:hypothetical protein